MTRNSQTDSLTVCDSQPGRLKKCLGRNSETPSSNTRYARARVLESLLIW